MSGYDFDWSNADWKAIANTLGLGSTRSLDNTALDTYFDNSVRPISYNGRWFTYSNPNYEDLSIARWPGGREAWEASHQATTPTVQGDSASGSTQQASNPYQDWYDYWKGVYGEDFSTWPNPESSQTYYQGTLPSGLQWATPNVSSTQTYGSGGGGSNVNPYEWWKNYFSGGSSSGSSSGGK